MRTLVLVVSSTLLLALACVASVAVGAKGLSWHELNAVLHGVGSPEVRALVWSYRIPRTVIAIVVGAALAVAGALIQALTRNPLADPGILGVNAGAAFAVTIAISALHVTSTAGLVWPALVGAALTTLAVVALGATGRGPSTPMRMTLSGVALAAFLSGITAAIRLLEPGTFDRLRVWASGSVSGRSLADLANVVPLVVVGLAIAMVVARPMNAVALGEDLAASLGTSIRWARIGTVVAVTLLAGAATAIAGPIGFVGLMVPHAVRWITGPDQRRIIAASVPLGSLLLVTSDIVARVAIASRELPVGVVTAFVGAPVLIAMVRRKGASSL